MIGYGNVTNFVLNDTAIPSVTSTIIPVEHKPVIFNYLDKLSKSTI